MMRFERKHILIVGATGNLGSGLARFLRNEGAELILSARNEKKLTALGESLGVPCIPLKVLFSDNGLQLPDDAKALDGVVDAAGIAPLAPLKYIKDSDLHNCLTSNLERPILYLRDLLKSGKLNDGASIVWLSSLAASLATPGYAMYAASKAGLEAAARNMARDLAPRGIRLNCIAPGMIESEMADLAGEKMSEEALSQHFKEYPLGPGRVNDVSEAAAFLLSAQSRWITGTVLTLDGGFGLMKG